MEAVKQILPLVLLGSVAGVMLGVGATATPNDLFYVLRRPRLLLKAVVAVNVVPPIVAWLMTSLFPLDPVVRGGIMLMSVSPVAPVLPASGLKPGGHREYAFGVYVAMALLSLVLVPLTVWIIGRVYGRDYVVPPAALFRLVVLAVLIPLAIGQVLRRLAPAWADRTGPLIVKLAMLLLIVAAVPVVVLSLPKMLDLVGDGSVFCIIVVVAAAVLAGHLLGGPDIRDRVTLANTASLRHPGIAIALAKALTLDMHVAGAVLFFLVLGFLATIPYKTWAKRRLAAEKPT